MVDVSIIIVSYNSLDQILANISSIRKNIKSLSYEIIVVNNHVQDKKLSAILKAYDDVTVIEAGENLGFGRANNLGLEQAKGKFILFVNPDVVFLSDIRELADCLKKDAGIGLIGPVTYGAGGKILPSCGEYPSIKNFISYSFFLNSLFPRVKWWGNFSMRYFDFRETREVDWISGAFMLGRKSTIEQIGGFDKDFFMYCEDIDICWRLRKAGYRIVFSNKAEIVHYEGHAVRDKSTEKAKMIVESSSILWSKHYSPGTVKKLFVILYIGSLLRKIAWQIINFTGISNRKNMSLYYGTIMKETSNQLRRMY